MYFGQFTQAYKLRWLAAVGSTEWLCSLSRLPGIRRDAGIWAAIAAIAITAFFIIFT